MDDSKRHKLKIIFDELCSGSEFVTPKDILCKYCGEKLPSPSSIPEYQIFKNLKSELHRNKVLEYKNEKDSKEGFRYKTEYAFYFRSIDDKNKIKRKSGDDKKLFETDGLQMLLSNNTAKDPRIQLECIKNYTNLNLVKTLVHHLGENVISFRYSEGYKETKEVIIHPHLLKEYNSRWFLFGYVEKDGSMRIENKPLDRIIFDNKSDIKQREDIEFIDAPIGYYNKYFDDIVGVSKDENKQPEIITIRTTDPKVHNLIRTKPIHPTQEETQEFVFKNKYEGEGEFTIRVIPNIELRARLLSYGGGIYVKGEGEVQQGIKKAVSYMTRWYLTKG